MVVECVAIFLIILAVALVFLRTHKKNYALLVLPVLIVPLAHLMAVYSQKTALAQFGLHPFFFIPAVDVCALALASILMGLFSHSLVSRKSRSSYLIICGLFSVVLVCILIANTLQTA